MSTIKASLPRSYPIRRDFVTMAREVHKVSHLQGNMDGVVGSNFFSSGLIIFAAAAKGGLLGI